MFLTIFFPSIVSFFTTGNILSLLDTLKLWFLFFFFLFAHDNVQMFTYFFFLLLHII